MSLGVLSGNVLGEVMATGPGHAVTDGSLGAPMAMGPGRAVTDGSLGCVACGSSFRGLKGLGRALSGALGESAVAVPTTLLLGVLIGGAAGYWMWGKPPEAVR